MADTIISRLLLGLDTKEFRNGIRTADRELQNFSKNIQNIGNVIGASFAVSIIQDFTMEAVKMGDQLTAAQQGFKRFGDDQALEGLRKSTKGLVSDLQLMQQSIQAGNFGIPIQELGNLFAFAQQRAKETGQEVDYLTQSIVTGIGRKSPLILDNLGISAVQLREKLGGVSAEAASIAEVTKAVGEIASEELAKMGSSADDTTTKTKQLATAWENWKAKAGQAISENTNEISKFAIQMQFIADVVKTVYPGVLNKFFFGQETPGTFQSAMDSVTQTIEQQNRALEDTKRIYEVFNPTVVKNVTTLVTLREKLKELQEQFENVDVSTAKFKDLRKEIELLQARINSLTKPVEGMMPKTETINLVSKGLNEVGNSVAGMQIQVQKAIPSINDLNTVYVDLNRQQKIFNELGGTMGRILSESFNAALVNGESFFKTFIHGLKQMVAQIMATAAAAAALAIALMALGIPGVKGLNFGQTFSGLYKAMGGVGGQFLEMGSSVPSMVGAGAGMIGGGGLGGGRTVLRGNDIFVSNSRTNFDISRIGG
jgi:chromosome segregation ATPase